MNKILIVDNDITSTLFIKNYLISQGFSVDTADSAKMAEELMIRENFSLVISEINSPEISANDFLYWLKQNRPKTQVIIISEMEIKDLKNISERTGAAHYFEKPVDLTQLNNYIRNYAFKGFTGNVTDISLFDFLKMILLSGKQKLIYINDKESKQTGKMYIRNGNIIHAEYEGNEGPDAFFEIMEIKNGVFSDITWREPDRISINLPSEELIAEAAKIFNPDTKEGSEKSALSAVAPIKILVVDDDLLTLNILEKYLQNQGLQVVVANSAILGAELLKSEHFNLVITDLNMPEVNGLEFLLWIKQHSPKSEVIIITSAGTSEIKKFANQKGALGYFEKPVNLKELDDFIKNKISDKRFSGNIKEIDLLDFIQIISFSGTNKLISVIDFVINQNGLIYLKNGQVVHAEISGLRGEEAFYSIIKLKSGIFSDLPWIEPSEITIRTSISELLKKATNIKDEITQEEKEAAEAENQNKDLVRAKPAYLQKAVVLGDALEKIRNEGDPVKKMTIYESGVALGIVIGRSNKNEVIQEMKNYSSAKGELQRTNQMFFFDDISLTIMFNEKDIVEEFNFGPLYQGETSQGIKISDPIEKAIKVYGKPKACTVKGAVWDNIAFFSNDNRSISTIRIRNSNFFNNAKDTLVDIPQPEKTPLPLHRPRKAIPEKSGVPELKFAEEKPGLNQEKVSQPLPATSHKAEEKPEINESAKDHKFTIYESGMALNIFLEKTLAEEVKNIMKNFSHSNGEIKYSKNILSYDDLSLSLLIDRKGAVKEVSFGKNYPGATEKGIRIGDDIRKAIAIYGEPESREENRINWDKLSLIFDAGKVTRIRLKKEK
jgi:DNA-binding response OmpR family regulator